jgi:hypothetical protein
MPRSAKVTQCAYDHPFGKSLTLSRFDMPLSGYLTNPACLYDQAQVGKVIAIIIAFDQNN